MRLVHKKCFWINIQSQRSDFTKNSKKSSIEINKCNPKNILIRINSKSNEETKQFITEQGKKKKIHSGQHLSLFSFSMTFPCNIFEQWSFYNHGIKSYSSHTIYVFPSGNKMVIWNMFRTKSAKLAILAKRITRNLFYAVLKTLHNRVLMNNLSFKITIWEWKIKIKLILTSIITA